MVSSYVGYAKGHTPAQLSAGGPVTACDPLKAGAPLWSWSHLWLRRGLVVCALAVCWGRDIVHSDLQIPDPSTLGWPEVALDLCRKCAKANECSEQEVQGTNLNYLREQNFQAL